MSQGELSYEVKHRKPGMGIPVFRGMRQEAGTSKSSLGSRERKGFALGTQATPACLKAVSTASSGKAFP